MKRQSMVAPALVALFAAVSFTAAFAQTATPAAAPTATSAAPAKPAAAHKTETASKKATTSGKSASATSAKHSSMPMVDINSASKEELAKVPAIGESIAEKIIASRPYKTSKELVSKGVMTQKEFDKVHSHLTAKQSS